MEDEDKLLKHKLIQCKGCDFIGLAIETIYRNKSGKTTEQFKTVYPEIEHYWDYDDSNSLEEKESEILPKAIYKLYEEVYETIEADLRVLSGIGLRTIIEAACLTNSIKGRTLKDKIENLFKEGYISQRELPILHKIREIGNLSAHEIKRPSESTIANGLLVVNHLLRSMYVIPQKAKKLK